MPQRRVRPARSANRSPRTACSPMRRAAHTGRRRGPPRSAPPATDRDSPQVRSMTARSHRQERHMTGSDFVPGLEGVIAFETEIAEPDREGNALRYRGVDIEDLVGRISFGNVWALLVDDKFGPGLPPAEPFPVPVHSGDIRVDVQSAVAML